jgi:hypothetical protein
MTQETKITNEDLDKRLQEIARRGKIMKSLININPFSHSTSYFKQLITDWFYIGSDAQLLAIVAAPMMFWGMDFLGSKPCTWIKKNLKFNIEWIWYPLFDALMFLMSHIGKLRTYYWVWWFAYYIEKDTNFNETMRKIASNPLVPYDMTEFYRILIYGNDDRFEFVKENILSIKIEKMYRDRQIRNGLVPQF